MRIVDFSANIAGPYATMILAQIGADVVHVESRQGDDSRQWAGVGDISVVHRLMGAGKRGMVIDLKNPQGLSVARTLI
ncbi:MAG: CoA transferase, partial [Betaproteobacteria bacterium]